jgi:hydroxymethylbilane synthase
MVQGRSTSGDRNRSVALSDAGDKGLFTADLSDALATGEAHLVVHSWKDLPIEARPDTFVAGTLKRADPRDVLLVPRTVRGQQPSRLRVLTSSPRRAWQLEQSLAALLPWPVLHLESVAIRGNVPTRLRKLIEGHGDALVVAKAALDRLLGDDADQQIREQMRSLVDRCAWMVLPVKHFPTAPAQGALAIEVARSRSDVVALVGAIADEATADAVREERETLARHGGGCHEAIGVTVLPRAYGRVRSVRGMLRNGGRLEEWSLHGPRRAIRVARPDSIWPRVGERQANARRRIDTGPLPDADGLWVTRTEALPPDTLPTEDQIIWTAGITTWRKLAGRGVWVHGSAEGLGDAEQPGLEWLAGRSVRWLRLTHVGSETPDAFATYIAEPEFPADLALRTHFFWTSGAAFRRALDQHPAIRAAEHASGPGRTAATIAETLGSDGRVSIWLDYDEWRNTILR